VTGGRAVAGFLLAMTLSGCAAQHSAREREAIPKKCISEMLITNRTVCGPTQLADYYMCDQIAIKAECVSAAAKEKAKKP
jgi:hypothetical protein